jgi:hypothetical protein
MVAVEVKRHGDGWRALVADNPQVREAGKSPDEAIGKLAWTLRNDLKLKLETIGFPNPHPPGGETVVEAGARRIVVTRRSSGYVAKFAETPGMWGSGRCWSAALGDLVQTWSGKFDLQICLPT